MTLHINEKLEKKLTCGLENEMRNLAEHTNYIHQSTRMSQNRDFYWILLSKVENV